MSIKTQKIIRFIPFVNFIVIGIQWILFYNRNSVPNKGKRIICNLLIAAVPCLILMAVEIVLKSIFDYVVLETIINLSVSFADMFIFSSVLICDQEEFFKAKNAE